MTSIFHLTVAADVERAARRNEYAPDTLRCDGFIHCSYAHQVEGIANTFFRGRTDVVLLEIDPARLPYPIVDEGEPGSGERYPHIYGALPMSAVLSIREVKLDMDGTFEMPCSVKQRMTSDE